MTTAPLPFAPPLTHAASDPIVLQQPQGKSDGTPNENNGWRSSAFSSPRSGYASATAYASISAISGGTHSSSSSHSQRSSIGNLMVQPDGSIVECPKVSPPRIFGNNVVPASLPTSPTQNPHRFSLGSVMSNGTGSGPASPMPSSRAAMPATPRQHTSARNSIGSAYSGHQRMLSGGNAQVYKQPLMSLTTTPAGLPPIMSGAHDMPLYAQNRYLNTPNSVVSPMSLKEQLEQLREMQRMNEVAALGDSYQAQLLAIDAQYQEQLRQIQLAGLALESSPGRPSPTNKRSEKYKTEMCESFEKTGLCKYNEKCQYAHDPAELRSVSRHVKYKSQICKTFKETRSCPYGKRCCFIHPLEDTEVLPKKDDHDDSKFTPSLLRQATTAQAMLSSPQVNLPVVSPSQLPVRGASPLLTRIGATMPRSEPSLVRQTAPMASNVASVNAHARLNEALMGALSIKDNLPTSARSSEHTTPGTELPNPLAESDRLLPAALHGIASASSSPSAQPKVGGSEDVWPTQKSHNPSPGKYDDTTKLLSSHGLSNPLGYLGPVTSDGWPTSNVTTKVSLPQSKAVMNGLPAPVRNGGSPQPSAQNSLWTRNQGVW